jgi:hypothetical protein
MTKMRIKAGVPTIQHLDQDQTKDLLRQLFKIQNVPDSVVEALAMPAVEHLTELIGESAAQEWLETQD